MNLPSKTFKKNSGLFFDPVIYPKQFGDDDYKIIYHIVNVCYPLRGLKCISKVVEYYIPNYDQKLLELALEKYNQRGKTLFRYNCFSHLGDLLTEQDMFFTRSGRKRYVKFKEYKFLLQRITKNLYESKNCKSVMVNKMFWKMKPEYFKCTGRKLDGHKLAFIFQVLQKHKYLHITYNTKNQRVAQIGPANPYYQLIKVPDIAKSELQDVMSKTDREIMELKAKLEIHEQLREEKDEALAELEKAKDTNQSLMEFHEESLVEIERLKAQIQTENLFSSRQTLA
ncbi:MAG: hypothetical protein FVQ82_10390 [Planctomycetes bacterium]|nr:hypothetical protein [Planctomycetota bacterium]